MAVPSAWPGITPSARRDVEPCWAWSRLRRAGSPSRPSRPPRNRPSAVPSSIASSAAGMSAAGRAGSVGAGGKLVGWGCQRRGPSARRYSRGVPPVRRARASGALQAAGGRWGGNAIGGSARPPRLVGAVGRLRLRGGSAPRRGAASARRAGAQTRSWPLSFAARSGLVPSASQVTSCSVSFVLGVHGPCRVNMDAQVRRRRPAG